MSRAFIFPGQGSQSIGMGRALCDAFPAARAVFEEVDDALSEKLSRIIFEGPEDDLGLTENTQPAIMTMSMAVMRVLEQEGGFRLPEKCAFVAGHSLGEYSALVAAGSLSLADGARLLRLRGRAMQRAVPVGVGGMAALIGAEMDVAEAIAAEAAQGEVCVAANDNAPGQIVISGHKAAVERAIALAGARGIKRAILLAVSAPFHSPLMAPAAEEMRAALAEIRLLVPTVPVVANVTASLVSDPVAICELLVQQVTGRVRWRESVAFMKEAGVSQMVEVGAGNVLSGIVRRCDKEMAVVSGSDPVGIAAILEELQ
ncbi:MAG TPA: [acyl-carrier-protein] S-malonyltransferase [Rhodospirillaceae bacterium]|nr:MAG: [acyl-carrier-protein] S-malonyltransferase [Alphaproteobacteria bacterium GWF2_58_20]HAU28795.1 [acyl-carrier-protein] S-malonyltransferase [Rhodospirillaceae bacterium]